MRVFHMRENIRQRCICICLIPMLCFAFLGLWGFGSTISLYAATAQGVYDDAGLMTEGECGELEQQIADLKEKTSWEIYVVTTEDAGGKTAEAYADDFLVEHVVDAQDGVALLVDMDNREIWISTMGEAIRYLTDDRIERMLDHAYGSVSEGEYADGFASMLADVQAYYQRGIESGQVSYDRETGEISRYHSLDFMEAAIAVLVAAGVFAGIFFGVKGKYQLHFGTYRYPYQEYGRVRLRVQEDRFIHTTVTHHHIQTDHNGGGGGGGVSTTHTSSSGTTHGGGGRKF